ncbi:MAG TPA: hypothetical protein VF759_13140 [Allosphingosinicella sp.]|jgi:hypothetical protein
MSAAAFLALLTIALLMLGALRLELNFRRKSDQAPSGEPRGPAPARRRPELRAAPAGGYWQAPLSAPPFAKT